MNKRELALAKSIQNGNLTLGDAKVTFNHYRAVMRFNRNYPDHADCCPLFTQSRATRRHLEGKCQSPTKT